MSHRQQEKERRRQEREAAEQAAARAASRKRLLRIGGGAIVAIVAIAVLAVVVLGGDSDSEGANTDLAADARAAGCTFTAAKSEGRDHTNGKVTYKTNPPTSGPHNPVPAQDGVYAAGNEPDKENWVHALEHGRILYQYKPGTPAAQVARFQRLAEEPLNDSPGYHTLVFQNNTDMPSQFALVGWTKSLTCDELTDASMAVMRDFREQYTDKAPELIP
jgi:Protein of unknown function (DUF3105)